VTGVAPAWRLTIRSCRLASPPNRCVANRTYFQAISIRYMHRERPVGGSQLLIKSDTCTKVGKNSFAHVCRRFPGRLSHRISSVAQLRTLHAPSSEHAHSRQSHGSEGQLSHGFCRAAEPTGVPPDLKWWPLTAAGPIWRSNTGSARGSTVMHADPAANRQRHCRSTRARETT